MDKRWIVAFLVVLLCIFFLQNLHLPGNNTALLQIFTQSLRFILGVSDGN